MNTDNSEKNGTYWWTILDIEPKADLFSYYYHYFGIGELKNFIIQNNEKVTQKILSAIEKMTKTDNKITLVNTKFS